MNKRRNFYFNLSYPCKFSEESITLSMNDKMANTINTQVR